MPTISNIWMVSRELDGVAGVGGVKDVTRQLLSAIAGHAIQANLVMPLYSRIDRTRHGLVDTDIELALPMDYAYERRVVRVRIYQAHLGGIRVYFVDAPCYSQKAGIYTYTQAEAIRSMGLDPVDFSGSPKEIALLHRVCAALEGGDGE